MIKIKHKIQRESNYFKCWGSINIFCWKPNVYILFIYRLSCANNNYIMHNYNLCVCFSASYFTWQCNIAHLISPCWILSSVLAWPLCNGKSLLHIKSSQSIAAVHHTRHHSFNCFILHENIQNRDVMYFLGDIVKLRCRFFIQFKSMYNSSSCIKRCLMSAKIP